MRQRWIIWSLRVRRIGDVDVADLPNAQHQYANGLGLLMHSELSKSARNAFSESSPYLRVETEAHEHIPGLDDVVSVTLGDKEVFIKHPVGQMTSKLAFSLNQWGQVSNAKRSGDFEHLLVWPHSAQRKRACSDCLQDIGTFRTRHSRAAFYPWLRSEIHGPLKDFAQKVIAANPDARYLSQIKPDPERAFGYLRVLNRLDEGDKPAVVDFINRHSELFDGWFVNWNSGANNRLVANQIVRSHRVFSPIFNHAESPRETS